MAELTRATVGDSRAWPCHYKKPGNRSESSWGNDDRTWETAGLEVAVDFCCRRNYISLLSFPGTAVGQGENRVSIVPPLMLSMGMLLAQPAAPTGRPAPDPARLREMLHDRTHPGERSQAALMLVQNETAEAEAIVRQGLRQTDEPEVALALASALWFERDGRFSEELLAALIAGTSAVRLAAAQTLAVTADTAILDRLQTIVEDPRFDSPVRQQALQAIGWTGKKAAVAVLIDQLACPDEGVQRTAAALLAELTGLPYGLDLARWRTWWQQQKDRPAEQWLEDRLAYQSSRAQRLENELRRTKAQLVLLHQQFYQRLPAADRLGHVQTLADHEDPTVRGLAVGWSSELIAAADSVGQRALGNLLLRLSNDGTVEVQRPAVLALGRINDPRAFEQLRRLLEQAKPPVRAAAAHALTQQALARTGGAELAPRNSDSVRKVVPLLQKALDDPALEVVVAAAEDLGTLGVPEAGPVLAVLLRHSSESVRQAAAQALERIAEPAVLDSVLTGLDDPSLTVRFSLVGALGRIASDPRGLTGAQRSRMLTRLEDLLLRDPDAGVRSRAATIIGQTGAQVELPFLWRRLQSREDSRVQEKTWSAIVEILGRSANLELVRQWDRTLTDAGQGARRLEMLTEISDRWKKDEAARPLVPGTTELLVQAQLDQGRWAAGLPLLRELLDRTSDSTDLDRRLRLLLRIAERAARDGNPAEALRAVREAQPFLPRTSGLAGEFERFEIQLRKQ
jgi:HEAT repeat protein